MKINIAIIGCGNLGTRHIQGLGKSKYKLNVHFYDVSIISLNKCKSFISEHSNELKNIIPIPYHDLSSLISLDIKFDLVIIATTAFKRSNLINFLSKNIRSSAWIIEKPITQSFREIDELLNAFELTTNNVWVNFARREIPWHQEMKFKYFENKRINMKITGKKIGIGSNISHFVDLINFWSDEVPISVDVSGLSNEWYDTKRNGYKDVDGVISVKFSSGSELSIISNDHFQELLIKAELEFDKINYQINEQKGTLRTNGTLIEKGTMLLQSQITGTLFDRIYEQELCNLTPLDLAAENYKKIISALIFHWNISNNINCETVPIT